MSEILVVVSKVKGKIREHKEFNTSGVALHRLSEHVEVICKLAAERAEADGRKTVMDRDIEKVIAGFRTDVEQ